MMISHVYTPTKLLKSTIISIPKDDKDSLSNPDTYIYIYISIYIYMYIYISIYLFNPIMLLLYV